MASVIHYRFKTATETNSLRFDGQSLRVFDIKVGKRGRQEVSGTNILSLRRTDASCLRLPTKRNTPACVHHDCLLSPCTVQAAIVAEKRLDKGLDFDLELSNPQSKEGASWVAKRGQLGARVSDGMDLMPPIICISNTDRRRPFCSCCSFLFPVYVDETKMIAKNSTVLVKRVAAPRGSAGLLARLRGNTPLTPQNMYVWRTESKQVRTVSVTCI
jgi:hypothetical protein